MDYSAGAAPVRSRPGPARMAAQTRAAGAARGRSAMAQWSKKKKKGQRRRRLGADPRAHSSDSDDGDFEVPAGDDARAPKVGERGGARGGRPRVLPRRRRGAPPRRRAPLKGMGGPGAPARVRALLIGCPEGWGRAYARSPPITSTGGSPLASHWLTGSLGAGLSALSFSDKYGRVARFSLAAWRVRRRA